MAPLWIRVCVWLGLPCWRLEVDFFDGLPLVVAWFGPFNNGLKLAATFATPRSHVQRYRAVLLWGDRAHFLPWHTSGYEMSGVDTLMVTYRVELNTPPLP